jgi:hypothetical protein
MARVVHPVTFLLALVPVGVGFFYVARYGVNAVVWDDWSTVSVLAKDVSGTLSLSDLFAQKGEHRVFFPLLVELGFAKLWGYNTVAEMYLTLTSFLAVLAILALAARRSLGRGWFFLLPLFAYLIFSLRQRENFLLGFQVQFAFVLVFGVLALYLLFLASSGRSLVPLFVLAVLSATVATYSSGGGLVVWPAGFLSIALAGAAIRKRWLMAVWAVVGIGEIAIYYHGYHNTPGLPTLLSSLGFPFHHPSAFLHFFTALLGASLFYGFRPAEVCGAVLFLVLAAVVILTVRRRDTRPMSFWLSLLSFLVLFSLSIVAARGSFGPPAALSSRYTAFSLLTVAALLALTSRLALREHSWAGIALFGVLAGLIAVSVPGTYVQGIRDGRHEKSARTRAAFVLYTYRYQPDELLLEIWDQPDIARVRKWAQLLEEKHYRAFASHRPHPSAPTLSGLRADPAPSNCSLDEVGRVVVPGQKLPLAVSPDRGYVVAGGWCVDKDGKHLAGGVYLKLDGRYLPDVFYGIRRQDVASFFHNKRLVYSGFEVAFPVPACPVCRHTLSIGALASDRESYYQPNLTISFVVMRHARRPLPAGSMPIRLWYP